MKAFLVIVYSIKQPLFMRIMLPYLNNSNWHIREGVLGLMIVSLLKGPNEFEDTTVIEHLTRGLNDKVARIKFVT